MTKASVGSIFPHTNPSGKIVWKVEVPNGHDLNGRRRFIRRTANTRAEAKILQRQLVSEIETNRLTPAREETLGDYAIWWVRAVKANHVRYSTATDYEDRIRRWIIPYLGKLILSSVEPKVIELWMNKLQGNGLATTTVNGARTILFGVMDHAYQTGLLQRNPVALAKPHRRRRDEKTFVKKPWNKVELLNALAAAEGTDMDLFVHLGVLLGLRRGESLGLRWCDIDFDSGLIHIRRTLKEERRFDSKGKVSVRLVTDQVKTKSSERSLRYGIEIGQALQRQKEYISALQKTAGLRWARNDWVFPSAVGTATNPNNMHKRFAAFCKQHRLRVIRVHDMRHTAAVFALSEGIELVAVSQALGHGQLGTTKSIYAPNVQNLNDRFSIGLDDVVFTEKMKQAPMLKDNSPQITDSDAV